MSRRSLSPPAANGERSGMATSRASELIELTDCRGALGVKIIGGRSSTGINFGIFVRSVLDGGIAAQDGRLTVGDQLLEANGKSLVGVSNEEAVRILKECAQSGCVKLMVARSDVARMDFRRLTASIMPNGKSPTATGSPLSSFSLQNSTFFSQTDNQDSHELSSTAAATVALSPPSQTSVHHNHHPIQSYKAPSGDIYATPIPKQERKQQSQSPLTSMPTFHPTTNAIITPTVTSTPQPAYVSSFKPPPKKPLPYGQNTEKQRENNDPGYATIAELGVQPKTVQSPRQLSDESADPGYATVGERFINDSFSIGRQQRARLSESLSPTPAHESQGENEVEYVTLRKIAGLGISVVGGIDVPEGPHIYIGNITDGLAVHQDGRLKVGDRLISIDDQSMVEITQQQAQKIITQFKLRQDVRDVTIGYIPQFGKSADTDMTAEASLTLASESQSSLISSEMTSNVGQRVGGGGGGSGGFGDGGSESQSSLTSPSDTPIIGPARKRRQSNPYSRYAREETPPSKMESSSLPRKQPLTPFRAKSATIAGSSSPNRLIGSSADTSIDSQASPLAHHRLSIDPTCKLKMDKLIVALGYLGFEPTSEQETLLRQKLNVHTDDQVVYSDFVRVAKELFGFQLDEREINTDALFHGSRMASDNNPADDSLRLSVSSPLGRGNDTGLREEESERILQKRIEKQASLEREKLIAESQKKKEGTFRQRSGGADVDRVIMERLRRERDEALREKEKWRIKYEEKSKQLDEEGVRFRADSDKKMDEIRAIRSRLHVADEAKKQARIKEKEYEDLVKKLYNEMETLKSELGFEDMQRKCAVMQCQLKKAESQKRTYEVATEKLLKFAETAYEVLKSGQGKSLTLRHDKEKGEPIRRNSSSSQADRTSPQPPLFLSRHYQPQQMAATLAQEAKDVVASVKKLIGDDPLPYGWEEAYTPDGLKYFQNHVTQTTTWIHPTTNVDYSGAFSENS